MLLLSGCPSSVLTKPLACRVRRRYEASPARLRCPACGIVTADHWTVTLQGPVGQADIVRLVSINQVAVGVNRDIHQAGSHRARLSSSSTTSTPIRFAVSALLILCTLYSDKAFAALRCVRRVRRCVYLSHSRARRFKVQEARHICRSICRALTRICHALVSAASPSAIDCRALVSNLPASAHSR